MVEEGDIFHVCNDYKGGRSGRPIKITGIEEARSSYSVDRVQFEYLDNGEESGMSVDGFEKDLDRDRFNPGKPEDCEKCGGEEE
jgi:hypothetical protein